MPRIIELPLAIFLILLSLPLLLLTALIVRVKLGTPLFYRQQRVGLNAKQFELIKFRTLQVPISRSQTDQQRMTPTGNWLRSLALDEWPQLFHILSGKMSFVGPRPLLPQYLDRYTPQQRLRHCVRPGLTSLAVIQGGNRLNWTERLQWDVEYIQSRSFKLDLIILLKTFQLLSKRLISPARTKHWSDEFSKG